MKHSNPTSLFPWAMFQCLAQATHLYRAPPAASLSRWPCSLQWGQGWEAGSQDLKNRIQLLCSQRVKAQWDYRRAASLLIWGFEEELSHGLGFRAAVDSWDKRIHPAPHRWRKGCLCFMRHTCPVVWCLYLYSTLFGNTGDDLSKVTWLKHGIASGFLKASPRTFLSCDLSFIF